MKEEQNSQRLKIQLLKNAAAKARMLQITVEKQKQEFIKMKDKYEKELQMKDSQIKK